MVFMYPLLNNFFYFTPKIYNVIILWVIIQNIYGIYAHTDDTLVYLSIYKMSYTSITHVKVSSLCPN